MSMIEFILNCDFNISSEIHSEIIYLRANRYNCVLFSKFSLHGSVVAPVVSTVNVKLAYFSSTLRVLEKQYIT